MMYQNKFVCAIKSEGKIIREFGDIVYLKFQSEYSILLKNLNSVKALVNVFIDGQNVTKNGLIINPNSEIDLERSLSNNNLKKGNKFKFIERNDSVEEHRGIGIEDGIIRIEFTFEDVNYLNVIKGEQWKPTPYPKQPIWYRDTYGSYYDASQNVSIGLAKTSLNIEQSSLRSVDATSFSTCSVNSVVTNDNGITVPGSLSNQEFSYGTISTLEQHSHIIVFKLLGEVNNKPVETVTVKTKPKCQTCGKLNKVNAKFCSNCGTSLTIV